MPSLLIGRNGLDPCRRGPARFSRPDGKILTSRAVPPSCHAAGRITVIGGHSKALGRPLT